MGKREHKVVVLAYIDCFDKKRDGLYKQLLDNVGKEWNFSGKFFN